LHSTSTIKIIRPARAKQDWQSVGHTKQIHNNPVINTLDHINHRLPSQLQLGVANTNCSSSLIKLHATIADKSAVVLIDSGATTCFISSQFAQKHSLSFSPLTQSSLSVTLATGIKASISHSADNIPIQLQSYKDRLDFMVIPLGECDDVVFGMN